MKIIGNILGQDIRLFDAVGEMVEYFSHMMIDDDGSDNRWRDKYYDPDTSLHYPARPNPLGEAIDAGSVPYIVVPPLIIESTKGIVLGCAGKARYKGVTIDCVVADIGPHKKLGEGSVELAKRLRIPFSPVSGGDEKYDVEYTLYPGQPAIVDGVTYELQRFGA